MCASVCWPLQHLFLDPDSSWDTNPAGARGPRSQVELSTQAESCLGEGLETGFKAQKQCKKQSLHGPHQWSPHGLEQIQRLLCSSLGQVTNAPISSCYREQGTQGQVRHPCFYYLPLGRGVPSAHCTTLTTTSAPDPLKPRCWYPWRPLLGQAAILKSRDHPTPPPLYLEHRPNRVSLGWAAA